VKQIRSHLPPHRRSNWLAGIHLVPLLVLLDAGELEIRARRGAAPRRAPRTLSRESSVLRLLP